MIALHRTYIGYTRNKSNPYANIVFEKVLSVDVVDEKFEGKEHKVAILQVTDGRREQKIRMIKMDEGWKVDVTQLESAKLVN
jgi:hypothetical protein